MNISLTPELEELVEKKLKSGMYHSVSEVIREGLRLLIEQDELRELRLQELKKQIQQGYESASRGELRPWNVSDFKQAVRTRSNGKSNDKKCSA